jgi:hypothetical protein
MYAFCERPQKVCGPIEMPLGLESVVGVQHLDFSRNHSSVSFEILNKTL